MRRRITLVVVLGAVLLVAGCATGGWWSEDAGTPTTPTTVTESEGEGQTATTAAPERVWPDEPIVVAVTDTTGSTRDFEPLVREAMAYWEGNASEYLGYPVEFVLRPSATDPDVEVHLVREIDDCSGTADAVGCAPYLTARDAIDRPASVEVVAGLSDGSTVRVLEHELGHVLGLDHGQEPQSVMARSALLTTLPRANATERRLPWQTDVLRVFVDESGARSPAAARDQVDRAVAYVDRGADGTVPENASFVFVDERRRADVVISFPDESPCDGGDGSCGRRTGVDVDGDEALEYYTRLDISLVNVDADAIAWHVAYWLGYGFGFDERSDWPPVLRNASAAERRSQWWDRNGTTTASHTVGTPDSLRPPDDRGLQQRVDETDQGRLLAIGPDGTVGHAVGSDALVGAREQRLAVHQEDAPEFAGLDRV